MRRDSHVSQSPYEVRCARCDVSFPVGTKDCIHCGGPTGPPGAEPSLSTAVDTGSGFDPGTAVPEPSTFGGYDDAYSDSSVDLERARGPYGMGDFGDTAPGDVEVYDPEDDRSGEAQSPMRAILSSLGGMIWIVIFVLISIARSCGE